MNTPPKKIGIIGGAGPMASCLLYRLIINECQTQYACAKDADFPEIILISYPFADMVTAQAATENRTILVKQLQECFDRLAYEGAQIVAIACNTLHAFLDDVKIPKTCQFIHIAQATSQYAKRMGLDRLVLLSTSTTAAASIYKDCIIPNANDLKRVDQVIEKIHSASAGLADAQTLADVAQVYPGDGVILGCTDLPVLLAQYPHVMTSERVALDTVDILAKEVVRSSFGS